MTKPKFTPGPWIAHEGFAEQDYVYSRDDKCTSNHIICKVFTRPKTEVRGCPDAHLIAAAPELYAELKEILSSLDTFPQVAPGVDHPEVFELKWKIRKLLRKASGESEVSDD